MCHFCAFSSSNSGLCVSNGLVISGSNKRDKHHTRKGITLRTKCRRLRLLCFRSCVNRRLRIKCSKQGILRAILPSAVLFMPSWVDTNGSLSNALSSVR